MRHTTVKALLAGLISVLLLGALTAPTMADSKRDLEREKKGVNGKIDSAKDHVDESTKELKAARAALTKAQSSLKRAEAKLGETRGQLAVAQVEDRNLQLRLAETEAALGVSIAKLKRGKAELVKSEQAVEDFTVQNVQQGDRGLRAFSRLLSGDDPSDFTEQMSINDSVSDAQLATMQELDATRVVLKLKRDEVQALRNKVKKQREEAAANLKVQQQLEAAAAEQAVAVAALVRTKNSAKKSANKALKDDLGLLRKLEADRNRLNAQLAALAAKDRKSGGAGVGGDGGGTLSYPVSGRITSSYGMRVHPVTGRYKLHDGTDFGVGCGTPIRAAASGTIIQQYYNGGYGNRVILNNGVKRGKSVVTTYNHLSRFARSTGSKVGRGDVIGYVGSTGYSTGCHLHFMVIVNGSPQNPMGWL
ncbi:MAG: peptidoglycan DD-metalloendopeptidase family protein [Aeromicrobium sp.]|uniref:peptidoglycan DD-metalloendopeptidase family protein n=1 Tax=Aeromicrobium sp. TaxID=1871063 RepID=UPI003C62BC7E